MKKLLTIICVYFFTIGAAQNSREFFAGRTIPGVTKEKLANAKMIKDIIPNCPTHWNTIIDLLSVDVITKSDGKELKAIGNSETLNEEQKNILNKADEGSDINVKIKFKYKDATWPIGDFGSEQKMELLSTVIPEKEAEYRGGDKALSNYLRRNLNYYLSQSDLKKIKGVLLFTVNEDGKVTETKLSEASVDPKLDKIILDAFNNMPSWLPAEDSKGTKVKQNFSYAVPGSNTSPNSKTGKGC